MIQDLTKIGGKKLEDNILNPNLIDEEDYQEVSLRPKKLSEYIGQNKVKESMKVYIEAAKKRGEALDHAAVCQKACGACLRGFVWAVLPGDAEADYGEAF